MDEKQDIILKFIKEGKSQRQIQRETGISRDTIRRYVNNYEECLRKLNQNTDEINKVELIDDLVSKPKYKSSPRVKNAVTPQVISKLNEFIKENEHRRLNGMYKQQRRKIDMYEVLKAEGFNVSYPSIVNAVNNIERTKKEAFIKQEYVPGDVLEFDFGFVKLYTENNILREYSIAVFASAYSNYRWARLIPKQNTPCFLEVHALFFKHIDGVFNTLVYDNTKVAVKKFVGHTEKEATEALLKLSLYYKFRFRFCNAYRGNEKGHVERSVDFIRSKAFTDKLYFNSLDEANKHLEEVLNKLNNKCVYNQTKTPKELLDEEREYLLPSMPLYETSRIEDYRVNKFSVIMVDSCFYSVPDAYVNFIVRCKVYSTSIIVFHNEEKIAEHMKSEGFNNWSLKIEHYTRTLLRKPGALKNSLVFKQIDTKLKSIYDSMFKGNEKEFVKLIILVGEYGLDKTISAIETLKQICPTDINVSKIEFICSKKEYDNVINLNENESDIQKNSINMLNEFNTLLKN